MAMACVMWACKSVLRVGLSMCDVWESLAFCYVRGVVVFVMCWRWHVFCVLLSLCCEMALACVMGDVKSVSRVDSSMCYVWGAVCVGGWALAYVL